MTIATKEQLGFQFKQIVPIETSLGQIYLRSLTLWEDLQIPTDGPMVIIKRIAMHVCDAEGKPVLTDDDVKQIEACHAQIILRSINEFCDSLAKKN